MPRLYVNLQTFNSILQSPIFLVTQMAHFQAQQVVNWTPTYLPLPTIICIVVGQSIKKRQQHEGDANRFKTILKSFFNIQIHKKSITFSTEDWSLAKNVNHKLIQILLHAVCQRSILKFAPYLMNCRLKWPWGVCMCISRFGCYVMHNDCF